MSDVRTHVGKIIELTPPDYIDSFISEISSTFRCEVTKNYTIYMDDEDKFGYIYTKTGRLFTIDNCEETDSESINAIFKLNENEYSYVLQFYDGGTYFLEKLCNALDKTELNEAS